MGEERNIDPQLLRQNLSKEEIEEKFKCGALPMGFSDDLIWPKVLENFESLPDQTSKENQLKTLQTEENKIVAQLKRLEVQKCKLEAQLKTTKENREVLEEEVFCLKLFKDSALDKSSVFVRTAADVEKELAERIDKQEKSGFDGFTADCAGEVPLSLVFNGLGLSQSSIQQLRHLDGNEFCYTTIIMDCANSEIPLREQFELNYFQELWKFYHTFPRKNHSSKCVVCSCDTPEALCSLFQQHTKDFDEEWIRKEGITGRQFLGISPSLLRTIFRANNQRKLVDTLVYFKKIHEETFRVQK